MKLIARNDAAARKVLKEIRAIVSWSTDDSYILIESYVNCREQGFALASCDGAKVAFSGDRHSDDIVVYTGTRKDFELNTNIPSEEVWEKRTYFGRNEVVKAARFIVKYLEG